MYVGSADRSAQVRRCTWESDTTRVRRIYTHAFVPVHLAQFYSLTLHGPSVPKMILLSPMRSVIQCVLPFSIPLLDMFPTDKRIPKIRIPTLFIHGVDDEVVPFTHGQYLYEKSPSRGMVDPIWVQGAGHNDIFVPELMAGVKAFIEKDLT
ncbi:hypothetical protein BC938DRAFT_483051 [Jimgerdemannia flammicorona]|uniref:Alpha/Beta hydrolase protein n=1 Tax=Jimgerdemannia flammicorona TaxID=994334 RepID=A0A433QCP0_9FUNG|nr:hypothetical protein BC938DRAFT_483051 [Jimgerdemannia flammicorona]RUS27569.1 hypothetical protein BC938DRAFT_483051 [Jimgerdemannia flammicorona]